MLQIDNYYMFFIFLPREGIVVCVEHFGPFKCREVYSLRHRKTGSRPTMNGPPFIVLRFFSKP